MIAWLLRATIVSLLLFPKIGVGAESGILLGEICLIGLWAACSPAVLRFLRGEIGLAEPAWILAAFLAYFIAGSSILSGLRIGMFPVGAAVYVCRVLLYLVLVLGFTRLSDRDVAGENWSRFIVRTILLSAVLSTVHFAILYVMKRPPLVDILWTVQPGTRIIPIFGMKFSGAELGGLSVVGGGAANLLASLLLFGFVVAVVHGIKPSRAAVFLGFALAVVGLAQSRGGLVTLSLAGAWWLQQVLANRRQPLSAISVASFVVFGVIATFALFRLAAVLPVFTRLSQSFVSGEFDGSSVARFENYETVFEAWSADPVTMLLGLGYDEGVLQALTGWTLVESWYLSLLFCGGLVGALLFSWFLFSVYRRRRENDWYRVLWIFIVLNSPVNWAVTGGDFLGMPTLVAVTLCLGLGFMARPSPRTEVGAA